MTVHPRDCDLVIRAKAHDHQALTNIYEHHSPAIYRYIYYRVGDAELAEDLRSEVFLRMLESLERYEDRGWPLSAWLYRIAHDRTIDTLRRRRNHAQLPLDDWTATSDGPENTVDVQLDNEHLHATIDQLTDDQRTVIHMRFMQEMSVQEVAHVLGRTDSAIKALQFRGLRALKRSLSHQSV